MIAKGLKGGGLQTICFADRNKRAISLWSGAFFGGGFAGEREGALRALEIGLRILEGEFRNARAEHGLESVLGPLEEFVGLAVALLGVLQMVAKSGELVGEFFHLLF